MKTHEKLIADSQPKIRPKDRDVQIIKEATRLFIEHGYHSVRMDDIARTTGVTARALYRHFPSKSAILAASVEESQLLYLKFFENEAPDGSETLSELIPQLLDTAIESRQLTVLWQREARHLTLEERRPVRKRLNTIAKLLSNAIALERPELSSIQLELRAWGIASTLTSIGNHEITLSREEWLNTLGGACHAAAHSPLAIKQALSVRHPLPSATARHESILDAAAEAYANRGFLSVTNEDIGKTLGIAGPAIYRYFRTKQQLLDTLFIRLDEWRTLTHRRALRDRSGPLEELRQLIRSYMELCLDAPHLATIERTEIHLVSAEIHDVVVRGRDARQADWIQRVLQVVPYLTPAAARVRILAAGSFITDIVNTPRLWEGDAIGENVVSIAESILIGESKETC